MTRLGILLQTLASAIFVMAGLRFSTRPVTSSQPVHEFGPLLPLPLQPDPNRVMAIPHLYLDPSNWLMWSLLLTIWTLVLLDAAGQWIDPTDKEPARNGRSLIWPTFSLAMVGAALGPWLFAHRPGWLVIGSALTAAIAILAARQGAGRQRPAIGFFAGWATAVFSAALAGLAAATLSLPVQALSALAILPGAAIGMAAQVWIGPSIGYSTALIWAFCGIAVTTMGSDPMIALAAIIGIAGMAAVLVRAAS
ncbi:hypothetical protein [Paracoccus sp. (in: a-proteobacteria)]|uniref:hypothetical protein n=1 Tax=Paracoccus sp. TaxID=267 RepID=UPI00396C9F31